MFDLGLLADPARGAHHSPEAFDAFVADYVADVHPVFKAHLVLGMTILLLFPFTRLVHMLSAPVWYLNRTGWQIVRTRRMLSGAPRLPQAAE